MDLGSGAFGKVISSAFMNRNSVLVKDILERCFTSLHVRAQPGNSQMESADAHILEF
jgi:hypothetical protein